MFTILHLCEYLHKFIGVKGVRKVARANPMAKNQRRRTQEALFASSPTTTPPDEEKAVERTENALNAVHEFKVDLSDDEAKELERAFRALPSEPMRPIPPEEHISRQYGIAPNCTNVPRLLYAILCEVVRGRV